ncbi:MAG: MBL fold metallo-hydrolase [Planctomycetes bacterium]|jgi:phosphoribosyl 1,2-cyclic phosphate phosphodiesterase|nr:MBL fold metallo-hydrolase [Planctomycetota bacterium]
MRATMGDWELLITGCGTSHGNPPWGYPQLWSEDPRDLRRRAGAVLSGPDGQVLLIDAGPDLQHQMRDPDRTWDGRSYPARCIVRCDGVLLTHDHADHSHGLNDLRHLNRLMGGTPISIFGAREHLDAVQTMFPFCFGDPDKLYYLGSPALLSVAMTDGALTDVGGLPVIAFPMSHGPAGRTTGFRCGGMAWLTDLKQLPAEADVYLRDLDLLVLDMLREQEHSTHLNWVEAQAIIARLKPRRTVLTHMGYEVKYREWEPRLPPGVVMAYDGYRCRFTA